MSLSVEGKALFRYKATGESPLNIRGLAVSNTEYFYSHIRVFTDRDHEEFPELSIENRISPRFQWNLGVLIANPTPVAAPVSVPESTGTGTATGTEIGEEGTGTGTVDQTSTGTSEPTETSETVTGTAGAPVESTETGNKVADEPVVGPTTTAAETASS
jgi:hypothetical protein